MNRYAMMETKWGKALFGIFLFAMLLLARDTLISSCLIGFTKSQILMVGVICILGLAFLIYNRRNLKQILTDRRMILLGLSAVILLVPMVGKGDWQLMYFSILLCVLTAVFLTYFTNVREVSKYYVLILVALGIYSIVVTYCLKKPAREGLINPAVFYNANDWEFFNFGLAYVNTAKYWHRNFGIFREPGVYQFFVLLAVYLNNYCVDWNRQWKLWACNVALAFTMLSTFALGGFAELGLLIVFLYFDKKWYRESWGKAAGIGSVALLVGAVGYFFYRMHQPFFNKSILFEFYDMFIRLTTDSDSMLDRQDAVTTNLQFFVKNPLVGDRIAEVLHGTNHNTSSTMLLFAILGIAGGTLNVAAWIALLWKRERNIAGNLILLVILFLSFNTQNLVANVFFWLFPMMALVERGLPLIEKE